MNEVHLLAVFVHGALASLHLLGVVYNVRRKNWLDVAAHTVGVAYDVRCTVHHCREAGRREERETPWRISLT